MIPVKVYEIIDRFFSGEQYFDESEIGNVWIARHGSKQVDMQKIVQRQEIMLRAYHAKPPQILKYHTQNKDIAYISEFETLTIEPKDGGQYEVAVRIWSIEDNEWQGYYVSDFSRDIHSKYLSGINTEGH